MWWLKADIGRAEGAAAFASKLRGPVISPTQYQTILNDFNADAQSRYQIIAVTSQRIDEAVQLTTRHKLRGYDAVHLACALHLSQIMTTNGFATLLFVSADHELLRAAQAEGLDADDPNKYS